MPDPAFGSLVFSAAVEEATQDSTILAAISRRIDLYTSGDWGSLDEDDWDGNIQTTRRNQGTLFGCYRLSRNRVVHITTFGYGTAQAKTIVGFRREV
jgi:hypothetical protein